MSVSCSARSSRESNRVEGYRGAYLLRREIPEGAEFVTLTLFDSMDAVRRFAGFVRSATVSEGRRPHPPCASSPSLAICLVTTVASSAMKGSICVGSTVRLTPAQTSWSCSRE